MFQQMKNIDSAFKQIRLFCIVMMSVSAAVCMYTIYKSYQLVSGSQQHIYILASGKALEAFSADRKDNIPVEAKDHVKMFHHYFFSLDPDDKVIKSNITKALYLADGSAKIQYDNLKENGYYSNIISGNVSQDVDVDSIVINLNNYPYYFKCYAEERIIRPTSIVTRNLITEGNLRNVTRSDNNPHGFLIEKWAILENKDIKVEQRYNAH
jgi:conjugative transposon TraK protein